MRLKQACGHKLHLQYLKCHLWIFHVKSLFHVLSWVGLTQIAFFLFCGISWHFCLLNQWFCRILRRLLYCWRGCMFCFRHLFKRRIVKYTFIIYVDSIEVTSMASINRQYCDKNLYQIFHKTGVRFNFEIATPGMDMSSNRNTIFVIIDSLWFCLRAL